MPMGVYMTYHPKPPPKPRAADADQVAHIDGLVKLGVTQRKVAQHLGIHCRTVSNIALRKGAYSGVPKESV